MIRLRLFLAVAAIIAALTAFSAAPALAQEDDWGWWDWNNPEESSWDEWEDVWGWDDLVITDTEWEDGTLELEGETTLWGEPAEVEFVCSDWWSCDLTEWDV